jgi:hypothetical protein
MNGSFMVLPQRHLILVSSVLSAFLNCRCLCLFVNPYQFITLFSFNVSLLLLFLAAGFTLLSTWFLGFLSLIISFFSSINTESATMERCPTWVGLSHYFLHASPLLHEIFSSLPCFHYPILWPCPKEPGVYFLLHVVVCQWRNLSI